MTDKFRSWVYVVEARAVAGGWGRGFRSASPSEPEEPGPSSSQSPSPSLASESALAARFRTQRRQRQAHAALSASAVTAPSAVPLSAAARRTVLCGGGAGPHAQERPSKQPTSSARAVQCSELPAPHGAAHGRRRRVAGQQRSRSAS